MHALHWLFFVPQRPQNLSSTPFFSEISHPSHSIIPPLSQNWVMYSAAGLGETYNLFAKVGRCVHTQCYPTEDESASLSTICLPPGRLRHVTTWFTVLGVTLRVFQSAPLQSANPYQSTHFDASRTSCQPRKACFICKFLFIVLHRCFNLFRNSSIMHISFYVRSESSWYTSIKTNFTFETSIKFLNPTFFSTSRLCSCFQLKTFLDWSTTTFPATVLIRFSNNSSKIPTSSKFPLTIWLSTVDSAAFRHVELQDQAGHQTVFNITERCALQFALKQAWQRPRTAS